MESQSSTTMVKQKGRDMSIKIVAASLFAGFWVAIGERTAANRLATTKINARWQW
jgi:hypothetical protein